MDNEKLRHTLLELVQKLVRGDFDGVARLTEGKQLSADDLKRIVQQWPAHLVMPPTDRLEDLLYGEPVMMVGAVPSGWGVYCKLWTDKEGWSDLSMVLTIRESSESFYGVEIDSIHVL